jgi:hypothetical protein
MLNKFAFASTFFTQTPPWCERGDLNPHTRNALDPKSSASTNSATLALLENKQL